jgi:predicted dienelactone hydrolase
VRLVSPLLSLGLVVCAVGCGGDTEPVDPIYEMPGPYAVGQETILVTDAVRGRTMNVELWYPADESARSAAETGAPVETIVVDGADQATYAGLLSSAPAGGPSAQTRAARSGAVATAGSPWPVLVFSHCHNCVRFSSFAVAERLASFGFVVAAPDHTDNTLFDDLAGVGVDLDADFLQVRGADVRFVLDRLLDSSAGEIPDGLRGQLDADRIGIYGHSFGAVTTGLVLQDDPRPRAGFGIASPMENPLIQGVTITDIDVPVGFLVAVEDNSITEIGNNFIRQNFDNAVVPAWKGEVADAGHWSFADICGLEDRFLACCGAGVRQTDGTDFDYLPIATGLAIAQAYTTAFFSAHLLGDENAARYMEQADEPTISIQFREP